MKKLLLATFITFLFLTSCKSTNCNKLCTTEPQPFLFELVDKSTGENVFTNNTYESRYIKIINLDDESRVNFSFLDEDDYNILMISSIGWQTEIINCSIKIDNNEIFTLYVDADRLSEDCCSYTKYNEIKIDNTGYTYNQENGIYTILIE